MLGLIQNPVGAIKVEINEFTKETATPCVIKMLRLCLRKSKASHAAGEVIVSGVGVSEGWL